MTRLDDIEARAAAATEGKWESTPTSGDVVRYESDDHAHCIIATCGRYDRSQPDALFIANARADIPWLVERVRELETALGKAVQHERERLRVAAGDVLPLRDPAGGRVVGRTLDPAIEAVLFVDREGSHLALYAAAPVALRLEAEGAMTEDMQPGYWLGRLADGTRSLEAKVYCGDRELSFSVTLSD